MNNLVAQRVRAATINGQSWLLAGIRGWGLLLLTLHLAAFRLSEETAWSLWPYTLLPSWLGWTLGLLAAALIIPAIHDLASEGMRRLWLIGLSLTPRFCRQNRGTELPTPASAPQCWFALAALLAGLLFWLARLRHLRWGDAYVLTVALSYPDGPLIYNWQAPLTVFIHQRLWQLLAEPWLGWPVAYVYATISIICGVIFVYVLLTFTARLGRNELETAVLAGLILTTGSMQLFFGYVENYTIISLGLLVVMFLSWRALRGEIKLIWPVLALSLTNGFHPSTTFLWPGMLLLSWLCWRRGRVSWLKALLQTGLPPVLVAGSILLLMERGDHGLAALLGDDRPGGGDGLWFVPLFETTTRWEHYTMFSAAHLLDWGNIHLLISPFGLPLLIMNLVTLYRFRLTIFDQPAEKEYSYFLGLTSAAYLLLTWLWNPDYGGRKDWDLFAPSAFIYTLLAGYLLVRTLSDRENLKAGGLFIIVISLLHTAAWIFTNTHPLPRE